MIIVHELQGKIATERHVFCACRTFTDIDCLALLLDAWLQRGDFLTCKFTTAHDLARQNSQNSPADNDLLVGWLLLPEGTTNFHILSEVLEHSYAHFYNHFKPAP